MGPWLSAALSVKGNGHCVLVCWSNLGRVDSNQVGSVRSFGYPVPCALVELVGTVVEAILA